MVSRVVTVFSLRTDSECRTMTTSWWTAGTRRPSWTRRRTSEDRGEQTGRYQYLLYFDVEIIQFNSQIPLDL